MRFPFWLTYLFVGRHPMLAIESKQGEGRCLLGGEGGTRTVLAATWSLVTSPHVGVLKAWTQDIRFRIHISSLKQGRHFGLKQHRDATEIKVNTRWQKSTKICMNSTNKMLQPS